jgi:predicted secreted protein
MSVNTNQIVYGGDMMIFLNPTGTTSTGVQPAAFSTGAKLTVNLGTREISSKDSGDWSEFAGGKFDWDASSEHLMNLSGVTGTTLSTKEVYASFVAKSPVYLALASKTGTSPTWTISSTKVKLSGQALITSMDFNASNGETATYSISLKGTGVLSIA